MQILAISPDPNTKSQELADRLKARYRFLTDGDLALTIESDFGEDVYATPAIADGRIYVRTSGHLYCFGGPVGK